MYFVQSDDGVQRIMWLIGELTTADNMHVNECGRFGKRKRVIQRQSEAFNLKKNEFLNNCRLKEFANFEEWSFNSV